jgi:hypothetical protein
MGTMVSALQRLPRVSSLHNVLQFAGRIRPVRSRLSLAHRALP